MGLRVGQSSARRYGKTAQAGAVAEGVARNIPAAPNGRCADFRRTAKLACSRGGLIAPERARYVRKLGVLNRGFT